MIENELAYNRQNYDGFTYPIKEQNFSSIPQKLKITAEYLSGFDLSDVKVYFDSDKPSKLNAFAYTQGNNIYISPGQEKYLPHEVWHVVQQKQGRVKPTVLLNGLEVNDNEDLEKEADIMAKEFCNYFSLIKFQERDIPCLTVDSNDSCIQLAEVEININNRSILNNEVKMQKIRDIRQELLNILTDAEGTRIINNIATYRNLEALLNAQPRPSKQDTYALGCTGQGGQVGGIVGTGFGDYIKNTDGNYINIVDLGIRESTLHAEMKIVSYNPNVTSIVATQECCIFCYGYLQSIGIMHGELRSDIWPRTGWTHPTMNFRLQSGTGPNVYFTMRFQRKERNYYLVSM